MESSPDSLSKSPYVKLKVVEALSTGPLELANSVQKQHGDLEQEIGNYRYSIGLDLCTMDLDSSVEKSSSIPSVFSDDISKEAISFQQLQDVICQLNLRTKLCIRDTSHHLARSAEPRGRLLTVNSGNEECRRVHRTGKSTKLVEYMNIETKTNPIHQFVALLLTVDPQRLQLDFMMMLCHSSLKRL